MRGVVSMGVAGWLAIAGCAPVPVSTADRAIGLGFRLVVETGSAVVAGVVTAPAPLVAAGGAVLTRGAAKAVDERPVPGATVVALDRKGQPLAQVPSVETDELGRFVVRGWRLGEPGFLEVRFADLAGHPRRLRAYVRPEAETACGEISLATTLLAARVSELGDQVPLFSADKLAQAATATRAQLPGLLEAAAREGLEATPQAGLEHLLDAVTLAPADPAQQSAQAEATARLTRAFGQVPALAEALSRAVETFLDVGFTVQAMAENQAPVVREERIRHLLVGRAELLCRDAAGELAGVTFWLNNDRVAEARHEGGAWVASLDSGQVPDGPYVLSAVGTPRLGGRSPRIARAFLYVRNTRPAGAFPCLAAEGRS